MAKNGKVPNRTQRNVLIANGYDPAEYFYVHMSGSDLVFRRKADGFELVLSAD